MGRDLRAEDPNCEMRQLERMLDDNCGVCHVYWPIHGALIDCEGECPVSHIDLTRLIDGGLISAGDAEGSLLLQRIRDNSMPPPASLLEPLTEQQLDGLQTFIDALDPAALPSCPLAADSTSD